jgi:hypothetical protein
VWWLTWQAAAWACGLGAPPELLRDRSVSLHELPAGMFLDQVAELDPPPAHPWGENRWGSRAEIEAAELSPAEFALVQAMRTARSYSSAWAAGEGLPLELRLYTAGAVAWEAGDRERAMAAFREVLLLPATERQRRSVWAQYMLAEGAATLEAADQDYQAVRELARAGFADAWSLALDSLGEQARRHLEVGEVVRAVHLYREQAAAASGSAQTSLLFVARQIVADPAQLELALKDERSRELLALYLYTRALEIPDPAALAEQLEAAAPGSGAWAGMDELAAASYRLGRYDQAERLAARTETALAHWVRAKLLLRAGQPEKAAQSYAAALSKLADKERQARLEGGIGDVWAYDTVSLEQRLSGELGVMSLARGEYTQALQLLLQQGDLYWADVAYVAERVLTAEELQQLVDRQPLEAPVTEDLRGLLGRRLVREGRSAEAVPYLTPLQSEPDDTAAHAEAYGRALEAAQRRLGGRVERAQAWFEAGRLARLHGLEIMGYEGDPDFALYEGQFDPQTTWTEAGEGRYRFDVPSPYTTDEELQRAERHKARPDRRFHYRQIAADHAERAADLLPPGSQAYAMVLCHASRWVATRDEARHQALWTRYVENGAFGLWHGGYMEACDEPDWAAARAQLQIPWQYRALGVSSVGAALLGLLGLWRWWRGR